MEEMEEEERGRTSTRKRRRKTRKKSTRTRIKTTTMGKKKLSTRVTKDGGEGELSNSIHRYL